MRSRRWIVFLFLILPAVLLWNRSTPLSQTTGTARSTASFWIGSNGTYSRSSLGASSNVSVGHGLLQSDAGSSLPDGIAIFGYRQGGVLVSEASVKASPTIQSGRIYAEVNGQVNTGLAIANPGDDDALLSFYFTNQDGTIFGSGSTTISARSQITKFLDQVPFNSGSSMSGSFTFTSSVPIGVTALRGFTNQRSEFLMTTLPVIALECREPGSSWSWTNIARRHWN